MSILDGIYVETPFDTKEILQSELNIVNKNRSNPLRWKGQFSPQLVQVFLDNYSKTNSIVFDPFVGSGTVLFESGLSKLAASGTEINPAAAILAKTYSFINIPTDLRNSYLQEISILLQKAFLHDLPFFDGLASTVGEDDTDKIKTKLIYVFQKLEGHLQKSLMETLITLLDFYQSDLSVDKIFRVWKRLKELVLHLPFSCQPIRIFLADARVTPLSDSSIDLVITSPPYINVFNYHQQYRASMEALNWDLLKISKSEFGSNRKHRGNRFLTVIQFCLDIAQTFDELTRVCRSAARLIFVVGRESMVRGTRFFNGEIVTEIAHQASGFNLILKQQRMYRNNFGQDIFEDILHFSPPRSKPSPEMSLEVARMISQEVLERSYTRVPEKSKSDIKLALKNICAINPSPLFDTNNIKEI